jgi:hypothetical protein
MSSTRPPVQCSHDDGFDGAPASVAKYGRSSVFVVATTRQRASIWRNS